MPAVSLMDMNLQRNRSRAAQLMAVYWSRARQECSRSSCSLLYIAKTTYQEASDDWGTAGGPGFTSLRPTPIGLYRRCGRKLDSSEMLYRGTEQDSVAAALQPGTNRSTPTDRAENGQEARRRPES